ncbi:acetate uptake transporter [Methanoplanus endosymbiosus]|uniref:Acetate uptake transporter n=1 Tax=Methanoplanus endosymbiosus TaxID=33865 RepID=A0A9E7TJ02_9EURY|nr:acetate uptake transporter [Methanoplanus endosymbiosus]UUX91379.1 acetate uptake transporter [Methanoplanus endosymbiosus]
MEPLEEKSRNNLFLMDNTANPAPLGLCAFGMTTILLSIHNAGITGLTSPIIAMALLYGGLAQLIVGIMEWKKNNTFGMVTFGSFGLFWISFAAILILPELGLAASPTAVDMASFLIVWGLLILGLFICTLKMHRILTVTFAAVLLLVIFLVAANLTGIHLVHTLAGVTGVIVGLLALYMGVGAVINEIYGSRVLPV